MVFSSLNIFGQKSYDSLWGEVSQARQERLPKTALSKVNEIIDKAEKEDNFCQLVQGQFVRLSLNEELDPDSLKGDIAKMEERLAKTSDPVQKAMLSVLLASTYEGYGSYFNVRDEDTQIGGETRRKELLGEGVVGSYDLLRLQKPLVRYGASAANNYAGHFPWGLTELDGYNGADTQPQGTIPSNDYRFLCQIPQMEIANNEAVTAADQNPMKGQ